METRARCLASLLRTIDSEYSPQVGRRPAQIWRLLETLYARGSRSLSAGFVRDYALLITSWGEHAPAYLRALHSELYVRCSSRRGASTRWPTPSTFGLCILSCMRRTDAFMASTWPPASPSPIPKRTSGAS